ncbi:gliding motility-associated ABC transporter ATP-binding subunit GldA [Xanthocytophaga agilis]|uniref:Gliding motility-associated ABC transporter ATP-binding subunit GldA n=1 Tax=Xanthocytophaga agilis TaxID=3048010 RepID=A0AAE3UH96_9BACT|nr:gliding motility-associated ABC transporter ATP-binding subunit GldA [Xanthocytophaga agilis]MDJ1502428.1 gliding motility-associated ABC transporter ATP-binding subunit GldA [Xanthocytophaga agilis]
MSINVSHFTKIYGEQRAVYDISFQTQPGQIVGFLGPNGAGKSTTMKTITCYLPPTEGTITVCGYDVLTQPIEVRRNIGYLPEHNPLYLDMYIKEYLQFIGSLHGLKGSILSKRIEQMVELCGLTREQKKKIGSLSKGYRQRVGLAQALIHDPQVLILDEPTTGLDPNQIVEIRQVIKNAGQQKTVIFSTHIMQEVEAICDRVIIINLGKIVADSTVKDLQAHQQGAVRIIVEFGSAINTQIIAGLAGVQSITERGNNTYEILTDGSTDVRASIFQIAAQHNWPLLGLKQEENTLEDVFRQLTK